MRKRFKTVRLSDRTAIVDVVFTDWGLFGVNGTTALADMGLWPPQHGKGYTSTFEFDGKRVTSVMPVKFGMQNVDRARESHDAGFMAMHDLDPTVLAFDGDRLEIVNGEPMLNGEPV